MSRSAAAATHHDRKLRRSPSPAAPRRVSGPAYDPRPRAVPAPRPLRIVAGGGAAIASRAAGLALGVSGSRAMDRLVGSRAWIVIIGFGLIGIVAMQVSLLKLNAGIGRAVDATATLERSNAALRLDVSQLSATDRIQRLAAEKGFVMPAPVDVNYLRAGELDRDGRKAARNMRAPQAGASAQTPSAALPAEPQADSAIVTSALGTTPKTTTTTPQGAPAGTQTGGGAPAAPATGTPTPPPAGGTTAPPGAPAASGGVAPPTAATTTGP